MSTVSSYSYQHLQQTLNTHGVKFSTGPFHLSVTSNILSVSDHVQRLYSDYPLLDENSFIDFHISVNRQSGIRHWVKPQVVFSLDGYQPFTPLPLPQAAAQFEWGLNWCIAGLSHQYLIIHSAVIEKNGISIMMPGQPGSGKSTLCAAMLFEGWRLLSDEMALISLTELKVQPVPRPVGLKNQSIDIIRNLHPNASFGNVVKGTTKGDVIHLQAPKDSVQHQDRKAEIKYIIFPTYKKNSQAETKEIAKADACMALIDNTFNFNILGTEGFTTITEVIGNANCYDITYSDLEQALRLIEQITSGHV